MKLSHFICINNLFVVMCHILTVSFHHLFHSYALLKFNRKKKKIKKKKVSRDTKYCKHVSFLSLVLIIIIKDFLYRLK